MYTSCRPLGMQTDGMDLHVSQCYAGKEAPPPAVVQPRISALSQYTACSLQRRHWHWRSAWVWPECQTPAWPCRFLDAELAKERCNAEVVLCCPIPMSTAGVLARSSEASSPQDDCLGVISLGLRGVSSSVNR